MDYEDYMSEDTRARMVLKDVYVCDPTKNETCTKTGCRTSCFLTTNEKYMADGFRPLTADEAMGVNVIADLERFVDGK